MSNARQRAGVAARAEIAPSELGEPERVMQTLRDGQPVRLREAEGPRLESMAEVVSFARFRSRRSPRSCGSRSTTRILAATASSMAPHSAASSRASRRPRRRVRRARARHRVRSRPSGLQPFPSGIRHRAAWSRSWGRSTRRWLARTRPRGSCPREIDRGLAADAGVDHREQGRGDEHELDAAQAERCGQSREVAVHGAAPECRREPHRAPRPPAPVRAARARASQSSSPKRRRRPPGGGDPQSVLSPGQLRAAPASSRANRRRSRAQPSRAACPEAAKSSPMRTRLARQPGGAQYIVTSSVTSCPTPLRRRAVHPQCASGASPRAALRAPRASDGPGGS